MSKMLFSLRGVPEDEAIEIREILEKSNIDYYETSAGNWGISMPALWLKNKVDFDEATNLLDKYHTQRAFSQREKYKQLKQEGRAKLLWDVLREKPLRFCIYILGIIFVLYIYIRMLFEFGL